MASDTPSADAAKQVAGEPLTTQPTKGSPSTKPTPIPNTGALERVTLRNNFYRDNYRRLMIVCIGLITLTACLGSWAIYERTNKPAPQYFATTYDGKLIPLIPLSDPSLNDNQLLQWAVEAAIASYSFNYVNYRKALQDLRSYFTKDGYQYFLNALKISNNLEAVISKKMVVTATPTGSAIILNKGVTSDGANQGIYRWQVQLPMVINFENQSTPITQYVILNMTIVRVPTLESPSGVGISSYVIREGKRP